MDENVNLIKMNAEEIINVGTCMYRIKFLTPLSLYTIKCIFFKLEDYRKKILY